MMYICIIVCVWLIVELINRVIANYFIYKQHKTERHNRDLVNGIKLVLAIHDHPESQIPEHRIKLDPKTLAQLRNLVYFDRLDVEKICKEANKRG